nr:uncharacterized G-patch domain protein DDB_G0278987 [Drosophila suzukii]
MFGGKRNNFGGRKVEAAPLIIRTIGIQKTSTALASLMRRRAVLLGEEEPDPEEETSAAQSIAEVTAGGTTESLEQRAARELLSASQNNGAEGIDGQKLVLPAVKADELPLDGAKEATLDDYDNIPIQQFGLAMLRGMGWVDPPPKKKGSGPIDDAPFLRPKGMGLGADKALKPKALLVQPEKNEVLEIKKQAYVRILGGKQKDQYGQIQGFDDHAGRVIVKMAIGGNKEAFNEFLCQPVSRKEYSQFGKCINSAKYEEFKKHENEHGQIIVKREKSTESRDRDRKEEARSHRTEHHDHKSFKSEEQRSSKDEYRRRCKDEEKRSYKDEDKRSYKDADKRSSKDEDKKSYKDEDRRAYEDDSRRAHRSYKEEGKAFKEEDRDRKKYVQDPRSSSSSASKREDRERRRSPSPSSTSSSKSKRDDRDRRRSQSPRSNRRAKSSSDEADDTGESTESDSDSAYERRKHKKKSSSRKSRKHSKKSKNKSKRADDESSLESDESLLRIIVGTPASTKKRPRRANTQDPARGLDLGTGSDSIYSVEIFI